MPVVQIFALFGGSLLLLTASVVIMYRAVQSQQQTMDRAHQEWVDEGSIPEEKPNFYFDGGY